METEIKLLLSPASRALVEAHPLFSAAPARRVHALSTYYDTPDLALRSRGLALRVRRTGDGFVQTLKSRDGGGFASRGEWEWSVASEAVDAGAVARDPDVLALLGPDLGRVVRVFTTDVWRDLRILRLDGGTVVESAVDVGEVRGGAGHQPLHELELELKGGPVGPMLRLATDLARAASLRFGPDSKSERGYALVAAEAPPREPADPRLPDDATLGTAFPRLVMAAASDFAAELSAAARGDVEGIHRLRTAVRKLRTLLALFAPHVEPTAAAGFDARLRALGRVLGSGRDWDVFLTETLAEAAGELGDAGLAPLRAAAVERRRDAQAGVEAAVGGREPTEVLLGLALWTADGGWLKRGRDGDKALGDLLPDLLDRLERRALKRGRGLGSLDGEALHRLRRGLKGVRYASEAVAPLFPARPLERYVGALKRVLKQLGDINDAAVTAERVGEIGRGDGDALVGPAEALLAWQGRRAAARGRGLRRSWRKLRRTEAFWA